jgi:ABC-2 type transport system ATP-binding protein
MDKASETYNPIVVERLSKSYGKIKALNELSFEVSRGELFGLIGPDGAGKTTLFRLLTTLLTPDSGRATVLGYDIVKQLRPIRSSVGYMPGRFSLYPDLSVEENLKFFASLFGVKVEDSYSLIAPIYSQLERFKTRRAGRLSGGMKQKLALCCALVHKPSLLFLDEPTTGVDPVSRREFWKMLLSLKEQGLTILVSTPYMDEAVLCDRVALMQGGHILQVDRPEAITARFREPLYAISSKDRYKLLLAARAYSDTLRCYPFGQAHHIVFKLGNPSPDAFKEAMQIAGLEDVSISSVKPNIEDCFISILSSN